MASEYIDTSEWAPAAVTGEPIYLSAVRERRAHCKLSIDALFAPDISRHKSSAHNRFAKPFNALY